MATDRRAFLRGAGAAGVAALTVGAASACADDDVSSSSGARVPTDRSALPLYRFRGERQAGVTAPPAPAGVVAGLDLRVDDRAGLRAVLGRLTDTIEHVMSGDPYEERAGGYPPLDTGILGPEPGPQGISIVVGFGDSLFDRRFGLGDRKPLELQPMPRFANDYLVREQRSHGDLSIVVNAGHQDAAVHAFRQVLRNTRGDLHPRWMREGFNHLLPDTGPGEAPVRNLMGFKDGTANPDAADEALMDDLVWVHDDEPDWAVGGTYQALRVIRMQVEFWDRTRLSEQESIFGRHRDSGAPLGGTAETDPVVHAGLDSHIARANPRTPGSERNLILRRGFNYMNGLDDNDQLDQGLLFVSYQRSLEDGFLTVQRRLDGEALEEYIRPVGGGLFFVPPPPSSDEHLGERLLA